MVRGSSEPRDLAARNAAYDYGLRALERGDYQDATDMLATVAAICPVDELGRRATLILAATELDPRNPEVRAGVAAELSAFQLMRPSRDAWSHAMARDLYLMALDYGADPIASNRPPTAGIFWSAYGLDGAQRDDAERRRQPVGEETARNAPARTDSPASAEQEALARSAVPASGPRCAVPAADRRLVLPELPREPLSRTLAALRGAADSSGNMAAANVDDVTALQAEVRRLQAALEEREQELARIRRTLRP